MAEPFDAIVIGAGEAGAVVASPAVAAGRRVVAVLVATLTYLDRRAARLRDRVASVPAHASD